MRKTVHRWGAAVLTAALALSLAGCKANTPTVAVTEAATEAVTEAAETETTSGDGGRRLVYARHL